MLLKNIDQTKATGPDELPARILKETAREIAGVLSVIFQQSYKEGTVPSDWLTARISAIYKKGDKANPSNYRPMSLTCITCKIMEHIVCSQIGRHLDHNNILHPNQHGFRKGLSCETQLVDTIHELAYSINQKTQTDVIFLDFSKAFDKVSHDKLLHKIRCYGIGGKTNTWISAFLCSRSQQVVVNGQTSQSAGVLSGVPQGSVLGPMLFLMYINDIAEGVTSQMRMFADDSIVYRQIHTAADHFTLASDLNKLLSWAKTWQMDFNVSKCADLSVTTKTNISAYNYFMGSQQIPRTDNQDYLGLPSTQNYRGNHISAKSRTKPARHLAYSKEQCTRRHRK